MSDIENDFQINPKPQEDFSINAPQIQDESKIEVNQHQPESSMTTENVVNAKGLSRLWFAVHQFSDSQVCLYLLPQSNS